MTSNFRKNYDNKVSTFFLIIGLSHIPVFFAMAQFFGTEVSVAVGFTIVVLLGPLISYIFSKGSTLTKILIAASMMCLSGIMIHLGKGMIEMHFHIFIAMASLVSFGNMLPIIVSLLVVALHHVGLFILIPSSLFNYDAGIEIVILHAAFAALQAITCLFISRKYGRFLDAQEEVLTNLTDSATRNHELARRMGEIAHQTLQINQDQQRDLTNMISDLQDMSAFLEKTAAEVKQGSEQVASSSSHAEKGKETVQSINTTLEEIDNRNQETASGMNEMSQQLSDIVSIIDKIADETKIIDTIVFQTKLLSFNASVEAARAGEHGKGFAVVAEEIGGLANISGEASSKISNLIEGSKVTADKILVTAKERTSRLSASGKEAITKGRSETSKSLSSLNYVVETIQKTQQDMHQVNTSSQEQLREVQKLMEVIKTVNLSSNSGRVLIEELSTLFDDLIRNSDDVKAVVARIQAKLN